MNLRFDGRTAIVTGAGRGLGAAYAQALASRGAAVVVNDLGTSAGGEGRELAPADEVVAAIRAAGGQAVASYDDITHPDAGKAIVGTALEAFGRVDIVVNNAGIARGGLFEDVSMDDFMAVV